MNINPLVRKTLRQQRSITINPNFDFIKNSADNVVNSTTNMLGDIKNQTDNIVSLSIESALDRSVYILKLADEKFRKEMLNNTEITVGVSAGPIQISVTRKINIE
jgi:hypothetical protein